MTRIGRGDSIATTQLRCERRLMNRTGEAAAAELVVAPFQSVSGSHTSKPICESAVGCASPWTRQNAGTSSLASTRSTSVTRTCGSLTRASAAQSLA